MSQKTRVGVVFGGNSGEHEVSLRSAASVAKLLDRNRFDVQYFGIDKKGNWYWIPENLAYQRPDLLQIVTQYPVSLSCAPTPVLNKNVARFFSIESQDKQYEVDVLFPVMHGPLCEDGSIQGLFDLSEIPYVGCGVLSSAIGMDKAIAKKLVQEAGVSIVPYQSLHKKEFQSGSFNFKEWSEALIQNLGLPCFVKPCNMGSSVGVSKVKTVSDLKPALEFAFQYDRKLLIEKFIDARELEVSVLEDKNAVDAKTSVVGEIVPQHEFYSYEAKYLDDNGAVLKIPAEISSSQMAQIQYIAKKVFSALECEGLARVDLFMDRKSGEIYLNEINTLPGFTSISMYPKLWEASGLRYQSLLTELIELAMYRHQEKAKLKKEF